MAVTKTKLAVFLTLLTLAGSAYGIYVLTHSPAEQAGGQAQAAMGMGMPVEAALAQAGVLRTKIQAVGTLVAQEGIILRPEISGRVVEIAFTEGQKVEKGQLLVKLEDSVYQAQYDQAVAQQALSERTYNRAVALLGRGAGTEQARDEASASLRSANAALSLAKANLDKTHIVAPFAGTIGIRKISVGDYLSPGQDIVSLQALNPMKLDFSVPETALASVTQGQKVELSLGAYPGQTFTGSVSAIDPQVDPATRSILIRALVPNDESKLTSGLFANVSLTTAEKPDTIFVPATAIWPVGNDSYVFRIAEGKASMTQVQILQRESEQVALAAGPVAAGDQVVTAGQTKLLMGPPGPVAVMVIGGQPAAPDAKAATAAEGAK